MKRELAAAALLLLLIAGAVWNLHSADRLNETVERSLHRAEVSARLIVNTASMKLYKRQIEDLIEKCAEEVRKSR